MKERACRGNNDDKLHDSEVRDSTKLAASWLHSGYITVENTGMCSFAVKRHYLYLFQESECKWLIWISDFCVHRWKTDLLFAI